MDGWEDETPSEAVEKLLMNTFIKNISYKKKLQNEANKIAEPVRKTVGANIDIALKNKKIKKGKFAKELGITQNHLSQLINGNKIESLRLLTFIAFKLNIPIHWFFETDEYRQQVSKWKSVYDDLIKGE